MPLDLTIILDYAARLSLAVVVGVMVSFRRKMTRSDLYVVQAHAFLATAGAMFGLIIADQLFRAIGLLAVANVVRYRYAIRNPRDAGTLVISLALGMACGTGLLTIAILGAVFMVFAGFVLDNFPQLLIFPRIRQCERMIVSITTRNFDETMAKLQEVFKRNGISFVLRETAQKTSEAKAGMTSIEMLVELPLTVNLTELTFQLKDDNIVRISWEEVKTVFY